VVSIVRRLSYGGRYTGRRSVLRERKAKRRAEGLWNGERWEGAGDWASCGGGSLWKREANAGYYRSIIVCGVVVCALLTLGAAVVAVHGG